MDLQQKDAVFLLELIIHKAAIMSEAVFDSGATSSFFVVYVTGKMQCPKCAKIVRAVDENGANYFTLQENRKTKKKGTIYISSNTSPKHTVSRHCTMILLMLVVYLSTSSVNVLYVRLHHFNVSFVSVLLIEP